MARSCSRMMVGSSCWVVMSGGRWLQGHNLVELVVVGMGFFITKKLSWFCLDLRCELCDVGWLELFGFEEDE